MALVAPEKTPLVETPVKVARGAVASAEKAGKRKTKKLKVALYETLNYKAKIITNRIKHMTNLIYVFLLF
jgi:hypothetical protein